MSQADARSARRQQAALALHHQLDDMLARAPELLDVRSDWGGGAHVELHGDQGVSQLVCGRELPHPFSALPYPYSLPAHARHSSFADQAAGDQAMHLECWDRVARAPNDANGWLMTAEFEYGAGRFLPAVLAAERAVALDPSLQGAQFLLGIAALECGRLADAEAAFARALARPDGDPVVELWRGLIARARGDLAGSRDLLEDACAHAEARGDVFCATSARRCLDGPIGWAPTMRRHLAWADPLRHLGGPRALDGARVIVQQSGGFGDALQQARWYPALRARGARAVAFHGRAALGELLLSCGLVEETIGLERPAFADLVLSSNVLELCFGEDGDFTAGGAYLPRPVVPESGTRPRVGLVHAGEHRMQRDVTRSLSVETARALIERCPEVEWVNLVAGPRAAELPELPAPLSNPALSFVATAGEVARCEAVVAVDTATLHLAGAMGVPTLALLPAWGDNRWGLFGDRTPYYDSVTLLRQERLGESGPLIALAAARVRALADELRRRRGSNRLG